MKIFRKVGILAVAMFTVLTFASCGDSDDEDDPEMPGTEQPSGSQKNPMVGKTIKCEIDRKTDTVREKGSHSITFHDERTFTEIHKVSIDLYDPIAKKWVRENDENIEWTGTYEYSKNQINLLYSSGGSSKLIREGNGWASDGLIYK